MKGRTQPPAVCAADANCLWYASYIAFAAFVFAMIEIEIEGKHGWCENLPTPHIGSSKHSLTVYHVLAFCFILTMTFSVFAARPALWSAQEGAFVFSILLMFFALEDVYWFILNPHYGITKINTAWWHVTCNNVPVIYIALPTLAAVIAGFAGYLSQFGSSLLAMGGVTLGVAVISPLYHFIYNRIHSAEDEVDE